jgi:hypothetical protein
MTPESVVAGALHDFAEFLADDLPGPLERMYWQQALQQRLELFCEARGLDRREIDHEWRKALGVQ